MRIKILRAHSRKRFIPFGWIIKKTQKTDWHHYAVDCGHYIIDAKSKGIRQVERECWHKEYRVVHQSEVEMPVSIYDMHEWLDSKVGTRYAFWQLIGIGFISFGWIKRNPFGKNAKYLVCHEFIVVMLARFLKVEIKDSDDYTFKDAEKIINQVSIK